MREQRSYRNRKNVMLVLFSIEWRHSRPVSDGCERVLVIATP